MQSLQHDDKGKISIKTTIFYEGTQGQVLKWLTTCMSLVLFSAIFTCLFFTISQISTLKEIARAIKEVNPGKL